MQSGPGYWLDPRDGKVYEVDSTHNEWILCPDNQRKIGLPSRHVEVLKSLDPLREIDEIRMVGVIFGLIRVRDYHRHLSIQFFSSKEEEADAALRAIDLALPKLMPGREHFLALHNLADDSSVTLWSREFTKKLQVANAVLKPAAGVIEYNEALRRKMRSLLQLASA